jgi:hypothetical protein
MRDLMNRGRRKKTLPPMQGAKIEFVKARKQSEMKWIATLNVNGWPHDIGMWAKDELDIMKQVFEMQRGGTVKGAFDVSK